MNIEATNLITELQSLAEAKETGQKDTKTSAQAAHEFEAFFIGFVFNTVFKSMPKSGFLSGGSANEVYNSMFMQELGNDLTKNPAKGLGLARQMMGMHKYVQSTETQQL